MHPFFHLFGLAIPAYGVMMAFGGALALVVVWLRRRRFVLPNDVDAVNLLAMGALGALVGAKLLYALVNFPAAARHWDVVLAHPMETVLFLGGGWVFYGGLIGGSLAVYRYIRKYRLDFGEAVDLLAPAIPAGHMLGRVGCFFAGCCYGVEIPWGLRYTNSLFPAAGHVPRLPVQLIEAFGELLIGLALLLYERRRTNSGRTLALYLMLYTPFRFVLEFFRDDAARGALLSLSTSQWISLALFAAGYLVWKKARLFPERATEENLLSPVP